MINYLKHVGIFAEIVDAGSLNGAARRLNMSPSGVSDALKALENYLGADLFIRNKKGIELMSGSLVDVIPDIKKSR